MEYVMVPVPEELVEDVDRFMKWIVWRDSQPSGQEHVRLEAGAGAYLAAGPPARRLLVTVAKAIIMDQIPISLADAVAAVGLDLHEAMGMVVEANANFHELEGSGAMVLPIPNPAPIAEGCPSWAHKVLAMREDVAEMLLDL